MNELKLITKKEILFKDNYLSYTKSMLHLPIFAISNDINNTSKTYCINLEKFDGFKNVEFNWPRLSIKNDFLVYSFILKKFYENCENGSSNQYSIKFSLSDFFDFSGVVRNNRKS